MHPWFRWIFHLNPGAYAFEALMANEFSGLEMQCVSPQYVPYGGAYDSADASNRGCSVIGSDANGLIDGDAYIRDQYQYSKHHIWRSFGILIGFWITFIIVTSLGFEFRNNHSGSSVVLYKRNVFNKSSPKDEETALSEKPTQPAAAPPAQPVKQSFFCWHDLDYYVKYEGHQKQLLNKVFGYVQPGNLVALMGCSGAGKTT